MIRGILGYPGAASRDDGIFMGESLQQERESPWALTLTERVPEAFETPPSDWPEKFFSGQSAKKNSQVTHMSSYTRLFSSSIAVVAWPVQREHFRGQKKTNTQRDFSRRTYRRYRKFLELTTPLSQVLHEANSYSIKRCY